MKKIAFYLPQYHSIPENDAWWGDGFTEWINVKNSVAQFNNHNQPEVPINNNYYDLSDSKVMEAQSKLALDYGIDGFCYYHYWFEGKLLLEKPLEQMLENKEIKMPYMMCWANETWSRTWDGADSEILIKQNYDEDEAAMLSHFEYLSKFFVDDRYIKKDNKPIMILYKPHLINNLSLLMSKWNEWARKIGFDGIYWGFQHHSAYNEIDNLGEFDFGIEFEPFFTVNEMEKKGFKFPLLVKIRKKLLGLPTVYDYDLIWKEILNRKPIERNVKMYPGAFPAWDNTPRRGNKAIIFFDANPIKFKKYLYDRIRIAKEEYKAEFLFINAWNEWAEGAHLEPDEKNKYGYLEAVKECK